MLAGGTCPRRTAALHGPLDASHVVLRKGACELGAFARSFLPSAPARVPEEVHVELQQQAAITASQAHLPRPLTPSNTRTPWPQGLPLSLFDEKFKLC